ncbi:MAG: hypothetical protein JXQ29_12600 [Planctomycetes bacterium]|nr:hypothetical protein [Planctomycetota bacterium]
MQVPHTSSGLKSRALRDRLPDAVEVTALVLFGLSILVLVSLLLDPPSRTVRGAGGGFFLSRELFLLLGAGTYIAAGLVGFWSAIIFFRHRIQNLAIKAFGIVLMALSFATLLSLVSTEWMTEVHYGGYAGAFVKQAFEGISPLISLPLIAILFLIATVFATDWFFYELVRGDGREARRTRPPSRLLPAVTAAEERLRAVPAPAALGGTRAVDDLAATAEEEEEPFAEPEFAAPDWQAGADAETEFDVSAPPEPPPPAPPAGPRIMRTVIPELELVRPVDERDEAAEPEASAPAPEEAVADGPAAEHAEHAVAAASDWAGFKLYLPDTGEEEEGTEAPREFLGRIAAYVEEEDDDEAGESGSIEAAMTATADLDDTPISREEDAPAGRPHAVAAALDAVADRIEAASNLSDLGLEPAGTEVLDVADREAEADDVITRSRARRTTAPLDTRDLEDEEGETPFEETLDDDEYDARDIIQIDFDEGTEEHEAATAPGPDRLLFSEAFHAVPAPDAPAQTEADFDPFADAPVTGETDEPALPELPPSRSRRAAARVDLAIEHLMPSLDRMKKKIADLETEPARAAADAERTYRQALETVFESRRASPVLLQKTLHLDAETAADLLGRMEREGVVGPRRDSRGTREILISRRRFEEIRGTRGQ